MIVILMGVAGSGKTHVGALLAATLGWRFVDADDIHPPENIAKMAAGTPLSDADREPWLDALRAGLLEIDRSGESAVAAVSALRHAYRDRLRDGLTAARIVYLRTDPLLVAERLSRRRGHFFEPSLMESQFAVLEEPADALVVDASGDPAAIVRVIIEALALR
jgi:gluconokinase